MALATWEDSCLYRPRRAAVQDAGIPADFRVPRSPRDQSTGLVRLHTLRPHASHGRGDEKSPREQRMGRAAACDILATFLRHSCSAVLAVVLAQVRALASAAGTGAHPARYHALPTTRIAPTSTRRTCNLLLRSCDLGGSPLAAPPGAARSAARPLSPILIPITSPISTLALDRLVDRPAFPVGSAPRPLVCHPALFVTSHVVSSPSRQRSIRPEICPGLFWAVSSQF